MKLCALSGSRFPALPVTGVAVRTALSVALLAAMTVPLCGLTGCRRQAPPAPDIVARVGPETLRYPDFERYLQNNIGDSGASLPSDVLSGLLDQFLDEELVRRTAIDRGVAAAGAPPRVALEALLRQQSTEPSEAEISAYYDGHGKEFLRPERVRLQQILTADRESAQRAQAAIMAGESFADVARRWSRDPSASRGGDQGELARDDLPAALAEVIFRLEPGQVSPIVPAEYGFHIFLVSERHPAEQAALGEVTEEIRGALRGEREDQHHAALVAEARSRYNPVIYGRNLPFTYQGQYPVVASRTPGGA